VMSPRNKSSLAYLVSLNPLEGSNLLRYLSKLERLVESRGLT
jgi:hypothetical protein